MKLKSFFAIAAAALAGCAAPSNSKNPQADYEADRWDCQKQVAAMVRPATPSDPAERVTRCKAAGFGEVECRSKDQPQTVGAAGGVLSGIAAAEANSAMPNCMKAKGWR